MNHAVFCGARLACCIQCRNFTPLAHLSVVKLESCVCKRPHSAVELNFLPVVLISHLVQPDSPNAVIKSGSVWRSLILVERRSTRVTFELCAVGFKLPTVSFELQTVGVELQTVEVELYTVEVELQTVEVELHTVEVELYTVEVELHTVEVELYAVEVELHTVEVELRTVEVELRTVEVELQTRASSCTPMASSHIV